MDVSQLCSNSSADSPPFPLPPTIKKTESTDPPKQRLTPASLDFILSPYKEPGTNTPIHTSNELVIDQCSKLCESIWQLKLQHKSMSVQDREVMINNLSKSAQSLFKTIRSSDDWVSKDNYKKRDSNRSPLPKYEEDEEDDDEEEDDEDEESTNDTNNSNFKDHAEYELIRQARNLQDTQSKPKYRRRNRRSMIGQKCHSCGTKDTPEWRRGPDGARTLCNACGLHYSKLLRKGSIGVQTQNYLLTGGIPPQTPSVVSASAISQNGKRNAAAITNSSSPLSSQPPINFPFVLMDPKYGLEKRESTTLVVVKQIDTPNNRNSISSSNSSSSKSTLSSTNSSASSLQQQHSFYTQQSDTSSSSKFVNISSPQLPLPSLNQQQDIVLGASNNGSKKSNNSNNASNQNNITPLRIHQWKNQ